MLKPVSGLLLAILFAPAVVAAQGAIQLTDSSGHTLVLKRPAKRVITLAPNLTELMFAIGAGGRLIAVSDYSDYPPAAGKLPRIGGAASIDVERIVALKPDLVLAWKTGTPQATQDYLRQLKLPVFELEFNKIEEIAGGMEILGKLTGRDSRAQAASRGFTRQLEALRQRYEKRAPVSVFYQVWDRPLMTLNGEHYVSNLIRLCGGRNVFAGLSSLVSTVDVESVIGRAPEAIVAAVGSKRSRQWQDQWSRWKTIPAVNNRKIFFIEPDLLSRPGSRVLQGAKILCRDLQSVRQSR